MSVFLDDGFKSVSVLRSRDTQQDYEEDDEKNHDETYSDDADEWDGHGGGCGGCGGLCATLYSSSPSRGSVVGF